MFDNLSQRLNQTVKSLTGRGRLTEDNIKDALREVRVSLIEADVALPVAKDFIERVKEKALGEKVMQSLTPGQALIKVVNDELTELMGGTQADINFNAAPPVVILMAGLQGSGKTTTSAKLGRFLKNQYKKSVLVTSADIYRPAAIKQLETLANDLDLHFEPSETSEKPLKIAERAIARAKREQIDVVIVDTAGRLHIDHDMMDEIKTLHKAIKPTETLFVVDSMTGQDAANTAKAFNDALEITGVVLTKIDGDARGGAALSVRQITGKPIKFIGTGEKTDAFEVFHPDRITSRLLGMGDVLSLIEEAEQKIDKDKAQKAAKKFKKGKTFDLQDFLEQMEQMEKMGSMSSLISKLPGIPNIDPELVKQQLSDKKFARMRAIVHSMTPKERRFPDVINGSRKKRIATGSGTEVQDVNRLLKQFSQMQKMMKKLSKKGGAMKMMRQMQGMMGQGGGMPPMGGGGFPFS
ncbi:MAG: signal recognition particle protein [Gammaproteobacteria bacterium CG11_big_fil_rev_8_21_14_0_20_46_22]|nr:MAG: signal recognition particle protein [Gammaproteobacteria bacterium CG12_big_fil_rev_8_21_14_0_65_46_12]PIR10867.1 MAG: signal recognition particle protein [Gammaproteobacteria bacterium CG11_big_fil_rev_8_21_14_0_20_46_22]